MSNKTTIRRPATMPEFVTKKGRKLEALYSLFINDKFDCWGGKRYILETAIYHAEQGQTVQIVRR